MGHARFALLAVIVVMSSSAEAQVMHVEMHSDAGDFVGQGQDWNLTFTPSNTFALSAVGTVTEQGTGPSWLVLEALSKDFSTQWGLVLSSDGLSSDLSTGTYSDALLVWPPVADHPGISVSLDFQSATTATGSFTINDIEYYKDQQSGLWILTKFDASFIQYSNGSNAALTGTVTYNSVPEPATMAILGMGALAVLRRRRK